MTSGRFSRLSDSLFCFSFCERAMSVVPQGGKFTLLFSQSKVGVFRSPQLYAEMKSNRIQAPACI